MKAFNKTSRSIIATLIAGGALLAGGSAFAQQRGFDEHDHGLVANGQPHMVPTGVSINVGWHGDRYYDGHRYWGHDEWMRNHPHDRDPHRHDDHREPHRY